MQTAPIEAASATPVPIPTPIASPTAAATTATGTTPDLGWLAWAAGAIVVLGIGAALGYALARRRDRPADQPFAAEEQPLQLAEEHVIAPPPARPAPTPVAPPAAPVPPAPAAAPASPPPDFLVRRAAPGLTATLRPRRAGTNLTGAAVDYIVTLANPGAAPARDIRVDLGLLSANSGQDAQLRNFFQGQVDKPVVAPFDLPPNGQIELTGMATLPREALHVLTAQERRFFVPIVAISARYRADDRERQVTAAWIIGIDQGADTKMAPFRLDIPPRMHDRLASRTHEVAA